MMWNKEIDKEYVKGFDYMLAALGVYFLIAVLFNKPYAFIGIGIFTAFLIVYKIYDRNIGSNLSLKDVTRTIKLFPGEESVLELELKNGSFFPMVHGELNLRIGPSIRAYTLRDDREEYWGALHIPLSLMQKKKMVLHYPVVAEQRGVAKVSEISYRFPHLLSFNVIGLRYTPAYQTEFIVFPKPLPVFNMEEVFYMMPGEGRANFSPFEDIQSPLGTRDYSYSDPFHRINWNASVKTQGLQTNVYERVVDRSYVFIVNLGTGNETNMTRFNKRLESLMSYTAFLSEYATKKDLPFEIHINARKSGNIPYVHLAEGAGKAHYGNALEMLARISKQAMTVPFNQMLYLLGKQIIKPKTIVFIGDIPSDAVEIMDTWKQTQSSVFEIMETDNGAVAKPFVKEAMKYAT